MLSFIEDEDVIRKIQMQVSKKGMLKFTKNFITCKKTTLKIYSAMITLSLSVSVYLTFPYVGLHLKTMHNSKLSINPLSKSGFLSKTDWYFNENILGCSN